MGASRFWKTIHEVAEEQANRNHNPCGLGPGVVLRQLLRQQGCSVDHFFYAVRAVPGDGSRCLKLPGRRFILNR